MIEEWKDIEGYEGRYQVSSFGRVRSVDRDIVAPHPKTGVPTTYHKKGKILKLAISKNIKYYAAVIPYGRPRKYKSYFVHRLVAKAFIPNPNNLEEINHKDENHFNNKASNLEWCDRKYNQNYGTAKSRSGEKHRKPVEQISSDGKVIATFNSVKEASKETGIYHSRISNVCRGVKTCVTAGGYRWRYKET